MPGAGVIGVLPSEGPHETSLIAIASRLLSASVSRPAISIRPRRRQSSVIAVNWTPRTPPSCILAFPDDAEPGRPSPAGSAVPPGVVPPDDAPPGASAASADPYSGLRRFRKPKGTRSILLGLARVRADHLYHCVVCERRRFPELPALGDVAQQPAHDLAAPRLGQVRDEQQELRARD